MSIENRGQKIDVDSLKASVNIVDVIEQQIELEKRGSEYFGLCPFHDDHKKSLQVNEGKQIFKCFACDVGGDVIEFYQLQGMDFKNACMALAEYQTKDNSQRPSKRQFTEPKKQNFRQVIPAPQAAKYKQVIHPTYGRPSNIWKWTTTDGKMIGYTLRYELNEGKVILPLTWQRSDDFDNWMFKGFEAPRPLYNLQELTNRTNEPVLIVEGEKCSEAAKELFPYLVVTTWMGGTGAIEKTDWTPLYGRTICLWPDNDDPGRKAMIGIAKKLLNHVPIIKGIYLPKDVPLHWDIADVDWSQTQALEYMKNNVYQMHPKTKPPDATKEEPNSSENLHHSKVLSQMMKEIPSKVDFRDLAGLEEGENVKTRHYIVYSVKMILKVAKELKWNICNHNESVYLFNGCYWSRIKDEELKRFLGKAAKKMGWEESYSDHFQQRDHLFKQFTSESYLPVPVRDKNKILINLQNGTFEISKDGIQLRDFDPADFLTHQLPFEYDPDATASKFKRYLSDVLPDESLRLILQEYAGYIFVPTSTLKLEKVLMLHGPGHNGKSVFFDILEKLVGPDNFSTYSLQSLTNTNGYYRADLADRLVNYASEISGKVETSYFKTLASGEPIEARLPYKNPITIHDYAKLIFNVNQLPYDVEHTDGFFRRFLIIPFKVKITKEKKDARLAERIAKEELSGVLNWVLEGLYRLLKQEDFTPSDQADRELSSYRKESDSVALYMADSGYSKSIEKWKSQKELYESYRHYALGSGFNPVSTITFGKRLESIGYMREVKAPGQVVYVEKEKNTAPF